MSKKTTLSTLFSILFSLAKANEIKQEEIAWFRNELSRWFNNLLTF